jgi:hypothetical protein
MGPVLMTTYNHGLCVVSARRNGYLALALTLKESCADCVTHGQRGRCNAEDSADSG